MNDNWQAASPVLANHGYCVFAFNYGGASANADFQGTGDIAASAGQLASFVTKVLTVIESRDDEVVTPYSSAFLVGPAVTNITVQNQCPLDQSDHLEIAYDPVAMADMLNALDPASPVRVPCVPVPITGPIGPVPSF